MGLLDDIAASASAECQAGGLWWKIEKPDNTALVDSGVAWVDLLPAPAKAEAVAAGEINADLAAKIARSMTSASAVKAAVVRRDTARALVMASVVAVRKTQDDAWEPVKFISKKAHQDASKGLLWVDTLDVVTQDILAAQARVLLTEGLGDRLASFLGAA